MQHLTSPTPNYITIGEAARLAGLAEATIRYYIHIGRITSYELPEKGIPDELWDRLSAHARGNVARRRSIQVTTAEAIQAYLESRHQGQRTDLA